MRHMKHSWHRYNTDTERQVSVSNEQVEFSSPPKCQEKHDTGRSMGRELSGASVKSGGWVKFSSELEGNYSLFLSLKFLTHEHPSNFKYHTWEESVKLEATSNLFFWEACSKCGKKRTLNMWEIFECGLLPPYIDHLGSLMTSSETDRAIAHPRQDFYLWWW